MKRLTLTLILLCLLGGCTAPSAVTPSPTAGTPVPEAAPTPSATPSPAPQAVKLIDFPAFVRAVNDARRSNLAWTEADEAEGVSFTLTFPEEQKTAFTEAELKALQIKPAGGAVTLAQAREDVETAFKLLQTTYGAYDYFGGDAVFLPLREACLSDLEEMEAWDAQALGTVLSDRLAPILRDGHCTIGGTAMRERYMEYMYYVPDLYLDDTAGLDAAYVKPTIGPDGAVTYCFAALSHDGSDLPGAAEVGGAAVPLAWKRAGEYRNDSLAYNDTETAGVPVMRCYSMNDMDGGSRARLKHMASSGAEWAARPLFLLDVRGNGGGNDAYAMEWFEGLTGQWPQRKLAHWQKCSQFYMDYCVRQGRLSREEADNLLGWWDGSGQMDGAWAENGSTVFVLTDKGVASSGESMVEIMRTADNTVFVGGPTLGCALVWNQFQFYLPNSGLSLYFGTGLGFCESYMVQEGRGYLPDLWVDPVEAEEAVLRLIDHYGLNG